MNHRQIWQTCPSVSLACVCSFIPHILLFQEQSLSGEWAPHQLTKENKHRSLWPSRHKPISSCFFPKCNSELLVSSRGNKSALKRSLAYTDTDSLRRVCLWVKWPTSEKTVLLRVLAGSSQVKDKLYKSTICTQIRRSNRSFTESARLKTAIAKWNFWPYRYFCFTKRNCFTHQGTDFTKGTFEGWLPKFHSKVPP